MAGHTCQVPFHPPLDVYRVAASRVLAEPSEPSLGVEAGGPEAVALGHIGRRASRGELDAGPDGWPPRRVSFEVAGEVARE